jgi:hypothetical protein
MKSSKAWSEERLAAVRKRDYAVGDVWTVIKIDGGLTRLQFTRLTLTSGGQRHPSTSGVVVRAKEMPGNQICASWLGRRIRRGKAAKR